MQSRSFKYWPVSGAYAALLSAECGEQEDDYNYCMCSLVVKPDRDKLSLN